MKKVLVGLTALVGAIGYSAFTNTPPPPDDVYFQLDGSGAPVITIQPTLNKPAVCNTVGLVFCARKYTSYTVIPGVGSNPTTYIPGHNIPTTTTYKAS